MAGNVKEGHAKIAIIYYSATGHAHLVANAVAEGAKAAGAEVRVRRVRELAPDEAIDSNPLWRKHVEATKDVPIATLDDLEWADGYVFGTGTRYGVVSAQLKQFLDTAGPLWVQGKLSNKAVSAFTGAGNTHGGQETTILTLYNVMHHWGAVVVPPGYTDPSQYASGGNPYGLSYTADQKETKVPQEILTSARYLGGRVARFASVLAANRDKLTVPTESGTA